MVFPLLLVAELGLVNVGRASTLDHIWAPLAVVAGAWLACGITLLPRPRRRPWLSALVFTASTFASVVLETTGDGRAGYLSGWALPAFVLGPAAAIRLLDHARGVARQPARPPQLSGDGQPRAGQRSRAPGKGTAIPTGVGAIVWVAVLFIFHAGYDMGYRADGVIVGLTAVAAAWCVLALIGPLLTIRQLPAPATGSGLTVATHNVRMGYGTDGTFAPDKVARQVRSAGAHVVMLTEVDRGWLLNGGQDQLALLARA